MDGRFMDQIAEAMRQHRGGSTSGHGIGKFACSPSGRVGLSLRFCSVHAEESFHRFTRDLYVNRRSCQRPGPGGDVNVSSRRYWRSVMDFFYSTNKHADYGLEGAVVLDLITQDQSVQHVVATFPTEAFSGDRIDWGGEIYSMSNHLMVPADSLLIDSSRRCVLQ